jgi:hypothetical protein
MRSKVSNFCGVRLVPLASEQASKPEFECRLIAAIALAAGWTFAE